MVGKLYCPDRGDLIWLQFTPQTGREQAGLRPAIVLSPYIYNNKTRLAIACPITSQSKGYPFEVSLPAGLAVSGVILTDHIRNVDWLQRQARFIDKAPLIVLNNILERVMTLIS